jgi:hypothetical protein
LGTSASKKARLLAFEAKNIEHDNTEYPSALTKASATRNFALTMTSRRSSLIFGEQHKSGRVCLGQWLRQASALFALEMRKTATQAVLFPQFGLMTTFAQKRRTISAAVKQKGWNESRFSNNPCLILRSDTRLSRTINNASCLSLMQYSDHFQEKEAI